jgi:cytochrome c-type biogenesis protein CcmH/NrfG
MNTKRTIIILIATIIIIGGALAFFMMKKKAAEPAAGTSVTEATTTSGTRIVAQGNGTYTITQVPLNEGKGVPQPMPDLDRKVVFTNASLPADQKIVVSQKISTIQADLKKNAANFPDWINLGMYEKMAGDYQGTILTWQYAARLAPSSYIPLADLGNLYAYFLNDTAKGEDYYRQAIAKGPDQSNLYAQLAEIYRDSDKDISKAKAIIDQGLSKIPNDPGLLQFKASLQ